MPASSRPTRRYEYRVRWTREGRPVKTQIFQTKRGAAAKMVRLVKLDQEKHEIYYESGYESGRHYLHDLPDLVGDPTLEAREVGDWKQL